MSTDPLGGYSEVWSLGFTLVAYVLVFTAMGYGLDRWLRTTPWLMVTGVFVGAGLGFLQLVRLLFSTSSGDKAGDEKERGDRETGPDGGAGKH
jgi:ATP synthase protein I